MMLPAKACSQTKRFVVVLFLLLLGSVVQGAGTEADGLVEEVVVEAHPLSEGGVAQPTASLFGTALERAQEGTLGDTLRNIAGVNSASFGPAVGRPVEAAAGSSTRASAVDGCRGGSPAGFLYSLLYSCRR